MSVLIFRLNGVSNEEANDVRELLDNNQMAFYETHAGRWGLSIAALWLKNEDQLNEARYLLAEYQQQRERNNKGVTIEQSTWQRIVQDPLHYCLLIAAIIAVAAISVLPFLSLDN